jgi:hypothetical protein
LVPRPLAPLSAVVPGRALPAWLAPVRALKRVALPRAANDSEALGKLGPPARKDPGCRRSAESRRCACPVKSNYRVFEVKRPMLDDDREAVRLVRCGGTGTFQGVDSGRNRAKRVVARAKQHSPAKSGCIQ